MFSTDGESSEGSDGVDLCLQKILSGRNENQKGSGDQHRHQCRGGIDDVALECVYVQEIWLPLQSSNVKKY